MRRARSAREMGWCSRTRFKRIWRLTWREVERVARRKSRVSIFRTLARLRLVVASTINLARDLRTHRECRRVPRRFWARHFRAICAATAVGLGRFSSINEQDTRAESREPSGAAGGEFPAWASGSFIQYCRVHATHVACGHRPSALTPRDRHHPLGRGLAPTPFGARLMRPMVVLLAGAAALTATAAYAQAPTGQIQGTVRGETGVPLAGVTVTVTATRFGSVTWSDGRYTITAVPPGT